jgi:hypothetical protein
MFTQVDIELSREEAKPGDDLKITINTKPNSYVGLLGVDQSVLLLKRGNDLEKSLVFEELDKYNQKTRYNRRWYSPYLNSYADFDSSGAAIITNTKEEIRKIFIFISYHMLLLIHTIESLKIMIEGKEIFKRIFFLITKFCVGFHE